MASRASLLMCLGMAAALPRLAGAGEVKGRVFSRTQPVAGVTVAAVPYESPFAEAVREARSESAPKHLVSVVTRADGTFTLTLAASALPRGASFRLRLSGPGIVPAVCSDVFAANDSDSLGELGFERGAALAGKVLNARGGPVAGAKVTLWPSSVDEELEPESVTTSTAADGGFKFDLASERSNRLRVEAPGLAVVELERVRSGALTKPIVLRPGRGVDGVVLRNDHRTPAAGAVVRYEGQGVSRWVATAANGAFHLDVVPEGAGALVADGGEWGRIRVSLVDAGKPTLVLAPTAALSGRVVDATSASPIARIRVAAHAGGATFVARSGPDGRYTLRGLPAEHYRLVADDPRYVPWSAEIVQVAAARTTSKDIALTLAATLSGRVVDENGLPLENARGIFLNSIAPGGSGPMRRIRRTGNSFGTGPDGTFSATRLAPGAGQTLTIRREEYEPRTLGGLTLRPGVNPKLTVVLSHGLALVGIVKDQSDRPIAGAELVLQQAFQPRGGRGAGRGLGSELLRMPIYVSKQTAADGRFEFKGLIEAEYALSVSHPGHGHEQVGPLTLAADKPHEPIEVRLRTGATITGFVRDKSGKGVEGVTVTARRAGVRVQGPSSGFGREPNSEPTEADGAFTIDGLVAGENYDLAPLAMALGVMPGGRALRQTGIAAPAEGIEFVLPGTGTIKGVVTDADGERTIADFEIGYSNSGMLRGFGGGGRRRNAGPNQSQSVHADDGQFVLTEVPVGTWDVEVTAEGYQPARASGVTVEEDGTSEGVTIALQRGAVVTGRVLDAASGKPIVDAQVRARLQGESRGGPRFPDTSDGRNASSDADGHFELKGLPPGSYSVSATHPDYSDDAQTIAVKEQPAASVDLRLGKGGALAGVVVAGGRPVAGASVGLAAPGEGLGRGGMGGGHNLTTDDAGHFRFDHLTPGRYSLMANLRSEASPSSEVVLLAGQSNESIVLTLGGGAAIHGHVLGLPETELAGVMVNANGPEDYRAFARTDASGSFLLSGAPAGPIELRAMTGDLGRSMRSAGAQVVVVEGQAEASADILFESGFRIDGHVTRGGQAVADAFVTAFGGSGGGRSATDRTDANGAYALEGVPEGTYQLSASATSGSGRGGAVVSRTVTVTSDLTVDFEAPLARLAGIVVEGSTQRPLSDASVQLTGAGRGGATTDSQGRFVIEGLEPRAYRVNVQKPAYQTETQELTAAEDSEVRVELVRGEGIGLLARDGVFGTPLRSVQVRVLDAQGQGVYGGSVPLDSEGRGEIPSLQPGTYQLRADATGYAPLSLSSITVPASALTLTLTPGGALTIRSGPETLALPQASVRLLSANGQVYLPSIYSSDGSIRLNGALRLLENVAPGRYTVSLNGGDGPQVDVREGEPAAAQLR